jgi:hypothetical protein
MGFQTKPPALARERRRLWQKLNDYISDNDGWTISQPDLATIRFECRADSSLPDLLQSAGHDVVSAGTNERLLPVTETITEHGTARKVARQHVAPIVVSVFEFRLPVG